LHYRKKYTKYRLKNSWVGAKHLIPIFGRGRGGGGVGGGGFGLALGQLFQLTQAREDQLEEGLMTGRHAGLGAARPVGRLQQAARHLQQPKFYVLTRMVSDPEPYWIRIRKWLKPDPDFEYRSGSRRKKIN